ncbi:MAG: hypothetical protein EXR72_26605 [Myxococcales bacterium]|nr:hypothetical protein [Myxococcales bacterium]
MNRLTTVTGRVAATAIAILGFTSGCQKAKGPNTSAPEDKLLFELGGKLAANDKEGALKLYDLDARQRTELWERTIKLTKKAEDQNTAVVNNTPRLGDAAALASVGDEAWKEITALAPGWAQELADGKCVSGAPGREDIGKWVIPKEKEGMPQELGLFVFNLRTALTWVPALRAHCPSGDFWIQLAQRKKSDPSLDQPLLVLRVAP